MYNITKNNKIILCNNNSNITVIILKDFQNVFFVFQYIIGTF